MAAASTALGRGAALRPLPAPQRYHLADTLTGEDYHLSDDSVVAITGIEIGYIDWAIACDGFFETGSWRITIAP